MSAYNLKQSRSGSSGNTTSKVYPRRQKKFYLVVVALLIGFVAVVTQSTRVTNAHNKKKAEAQKMVAANGQAFALREIDGGVVKAPVPTQRLVDSAYGFAPDGVTVAYAALSE